MLWLQLFLLTICIFVVASSGPDVPGVALRPDCQHCRRCVQYRSDTITRRVCAIYTSQRYKTKCGFWGWRRCTRYRRVCSSYKVVYAIRRVCIRWEWLPFCRCTPRDFPLEDASLGSLAQD